MVVMTVFMVVMVVVMMVPKIVVATAVSVVMVVMSVIMVVVVTVVFFARITETHVSFLFCLCGKNFVVWPVPPPSSRCHFWGLLMISVGVIASPKRPTKKKWPSVPSRLTVFKHPLTFTH